MESTSEDGFACGAGEWFLRRHHADYEVPYGRISLTELLRMVQLYNAGGYRPDPSGEDGWGWGP